MNYEEMTLEELETRAAEIATETAEATEERLAELNAELDGIEARRNAIAKETEERKEKMDAVINGEGDLVAVPEVKEERKIMTDMEIRKSPEYLEAWVEYQKGMASDEQRTLLTTNATGGTIAVPSYVEEIIHTAWENNELMRRIRKTYFKGNLKVGYEASASGASIHTEGGDPVTEEELVIGFVELIPTTIKKMVKYSTEVMDMKGQAWVDYIFDEVTYQIVLKAVNQTITAMNGSSLIGSYVSAVPGTITTADIVNAEGVLGGEATNLVFITTRQIAANIKAAALSAGYAFDPFDGLEVIYAPSLLPGVHGYVADLSGVQANFPNGDEVKFVFDEFTDAPSDLVRVIGRLMMAVDVVAPGKVVEIIDD